MTLGDTERSVVLDCTGVAASNPGCVLAVRRRRILTCAVSAVSRRPTVRRGGVKFQLNVAAGQSRLRIWIATG